MYQVRAVKLHRCFQPNSFQLDPWTVLAKRSAEDERNWRLDKKDWGRITAVLQKSQWKGELRLWSCHRFLECSHQPTRIPTSTRSRSAVHAKDVLNWFGVRQKRTLKSCQLQVHWCSRLRNDNFAHENTFRARKLSAQIDVLHEAKGLRRRNEINLCKVHEECPELLLEFYTKDRAWTWWIQGWPEREYAYKWTDKLDLVHLWINLQANSWWIS